MTRELKNWTVISQRVKEKSNGFISYLNYLTSSTHENHKNTRIVNIKELDIKFLYFTTKNCLKKDELNKIKGGRKVESYAQSFVFSLPPEIQPTNEEWIKIYVFVKNQLKEFLNCSNDCFYGNFHIQKTNNSHMNLMISRCDEGGRLLENLDKKSIIVLSKKSFDEAVKEIMKVEPKDYTIKKLDKEQKRRLNPFQLRTRRKIKPKILK